MNSFQAKILKFYVLFLLFHSKDVNENVMNGHLDKIAPGIVRVKEITHDYVNQPPEYVIVHPDLTESTVKNPVPMVSMAKTVNNFALVKMVQTALIQMAHAHAQKNGLEKIVIQNAPMVSMAKTVNNFALVKMVQTALKQICLLYTSPSPRDGLLSRMPSSA